MFAAGERVEVSSEEDGFLGVWFAGHIVSRNNVAAVVQYDELMTEDGTHLQEEVQIGHVRPVPPRFPKVDWVKGDAVEAYDKDGWWEGVVVKVLPRKHFRVYFERSLEEIAFPASELRCPQVWSDGKWTPLTQTRRDERFLESVEEANLQNNPNAALSPMTPLATGHKHAQKRKRGRPVKRSKSVKRRRAVNGRAKWSRLGANNSQKQIETQQLEMQGGSDKGEVESRVKGMENNNKNIPVPGYGPAGKGCRNLLKQAVKEQDAGVHTNSDISGIPGTVTPDIHQNRFNKEREDEGIPNLESSLQSRRTSNRHLAKTCRSSKLRRVELTAYYWLLQALYSMGPLNWKYEMLLTDARCLLHITNEEHSRELKRVISSGIYQ